jgi:hypothetical protein
MIGRLSGVLLEKNPPQLLLDVQGVAYEVDVPMSTFYNLPATGERVTLFTHLVVREDAHLLYGFGSENERRAFRQLVKVNGIGARIALSVLSGCRSPSSRRRSRCRSRAPHQDPGHRQEDRGAHAARAQGQARRRRHAPSASIGAPRPRTSCTRCCRSATATRKRSRGEATARRRRRGDGIRRR